MTKIYSLRDRVKVVMGMLSIATLAAFILGCGTVPTPQTAPTELQVATSGGFSAAFSELSPQYSVATGTRIVTSHGPSMGDTFNAIPARLARQEPLDVVILARSALDRLVDDGKVVPGSEVDLVVSRIAVVVRAGTPAPDISTPEALRAALLNARSVAWSDSASGVYIQSTMLARLGVADEVLPKGRMIRATPVGEIVARGEAEIGFQQLSELLPVQGIQIVGFLPDELQHATTFSGGIVAYSPRREEGIRLLEFLSSPDADAVIRRSGLEPSARPTVR